MFKKSLAGFIFSFTIIISMHNVSLAQTDVGVQLTTGGTAKCTFNGKVPFRSIKAASNNLVINTDTGETNVSIKSQVDTEKSTINADVLAVIDAVSNPLDLLQGKEVQFQSQKFEFSISSTRKSDGKVIEVTNETPDGQRTNVTGNIVVKTFDQSNKQASGVLKMVFDNTLHTIQKLGEDIQTDVNGKLTATCKFDNVPVNFSGSTSSLFGSL